MSVFAPALRFCPLLYIESSKLAETHCLVCLIFFTVCVDTKQLHFKADRVRSVCANAVSKQNEPELTNDKSDTNIL